MDWTYQTVAACVEPGCHCDDSRGLILYDGPDHAEATAALLQTPMGYVAEVVAYHESTVAY